MEDSSGAGAVPPVGTQDGGNGRDRIGLEGAVGGGAGYDAGARTRAEQPQEAREEFETDEEARAKDLALEQRIKRTLRDNDGQPPSTDKLKKKIKDVDHKYKYIGTRMDEANSFMDKAIARIEALTSTPQGRIDVVVDEMTDIAQQLETRAYGLRDDIFGKDYKPSNGNKPSGLLGKRRVAIKSRAEANISLDAIDTRLGELNVALEGYKKKAREVSNSGDADQILDYSDKVDEKVYQIQELEAKKGDVERKFQLYTGEIEDLTIDIKVGKATYEHMLSQAQELKMIGRELTSLPEGRKRLKERDSKVLVELIPRARTVIDKFRKIVEDAKGVSRAEYEILGESLGLDVGKANPHGERYDPSKGFVEEHEKSKDRNSDYLTQLRDKVKSNPLYGTDL